LLYFNNFLYSLIQDFRNLNRTNEILNSEENLKLENRYSDSFFYNNFKDNNHSKYDYNLDNTYENLERKYD
jgi:hypothetical protein